MPNPRRPLALRLRLPSSIGLALATLFVLPAMASAQTYVVDNLGDESSPYGCEVLGECSLREAIERSNELEGEDTIEFEVEGTIEPGVEALPRFTDPVSTKPARTSPMSSSNST